MSLHQDIMQAVADIVHVDGQTTFSEDDIQAKLAAEPERWQKNYAAVFQSMHTAPTQAGTIVEHDHQNVFEKLEGGQYQLTAKGKQMAQQARE